jgi:hypothetical protein
MPSLPPNGLDCGQSGIKFLKLKKPGGKALATASESILLARASAKAGQRCKAGRRPCLFPDETIGLEDKIIHRTPGPALMKTFAATGTA